jgi:hypothetical protein
MVITYPTVMYPNCQADLLSHLAALKSYFLLARGELFHSLLVEARR